MRVRFEWVAALCGSTPADGLKLYSPGGPRLSPVRTKNLVGRLRAGHVRCERHAWAVGPRTVGFPSEIEQATAVRMVCVGPRGS